MTIRETQIIVCMSCVALFACCTLCAKDEPVVQNVISCKGDIDGLFEMIKSGKHIDIFMAGEAFDKAIKKLSEKDVDRWLHYFEKKLFDINATDMKSWRKVSFVIDSVWNTAFAYWNKAPGLTEKERWMIKFKALEWEYRQLNWLKQVAPEDTRPLIQKRNNPRAPYRTEYGKWQHIVRGVESTFYKRHIAKSVYEAEREQYSEDFREWCLKEIEKIIGRPLTDDDIMFKEDVLRRRTERKKRAEEAEKKNVPDRDSK